MNYYEFSKKNKNEIFKILKTDDDGLSNEEAKRRVLREGLNISTDTKKKSALYFILQSFKDKFIMILLVLAVIDYITNDYIGTGIIICLGIASAMLRFV